jgi:flagellin FlaA/flagellin FlaB
MKAKLEEKLTDRGQVGIGTLIVFIAMVLVAAIAAGVLINTAGFLQTKSEQTGQESSAQVSNRVQVVSKVGTVANTDTITSYNGDLNGETSDDPEDLGVKKLTLTVMKSSGSGDVDLGAATISWNGPDKTKTLTHGGDDYSSESGVKDSGTDLSESTFTVHDVRGPDGSDRPVLTDQEDRYQITIDVGKVDKDDTGQVDYLAESENAQLRITTRSGATTLVRIKVPDSLAGDTSVTV